MLKLTPGANKANAILIRIVLFLIGGIAIITGMCLFSGDMWMLTPRAEQYQPATGDLVDVVIYEPSKFFFALLYVFIITLVWLLAVRKIPWRPIQHPILPLIVLIAAGDNEFNTLLPELRKLGEETRAVVLLGVIEKSSVHIGDDNFNGHKRVLLA